MIEALMRIRKCRRTAAAFFAAVFFLLILFSGPLQARLVGPDEAREVSLRLIEMENGRPELRLTPGSFQWAGLEPLIVGGRIIAYLVRMNPGGFMILADITESTPQVFVSYDGDPAKLTGHPILREILRRLDYAKVRLGYLPARLPADAPEADDPPDLAQVERNERAWALLSRPHASNAEVMAAFAGTAAVEPLTTSKWSQDEPYNDYTPRINGEATPTGCSATAMAQVMFFWKFPERGKGSHSYTWNGQTLSADFDHPYFWDRMLDRYTGSDFSAEQADAVARLMSDVGISIDMDYAVDGSAAYPNFGNALNKYFKYSAEIRESTRADAGSWEAYFQVIKEQLDAHLLPILSIYTADAGHAVVADGYRTSPSNQAHINMGWGGYADNYYSLENIFGFGTAEWDYAVINIRPAQFKLTITVTTGGTTTPAPGVYPYPFGTVRTVRVTAIPADHYAFLKWSGDASGSANPIDVVVDMERKVKAFFQQILYAPLHPAGEKILNRSFSQTEQINRITFEANPDNLDIRHYKIVLVDGDERRQLATIMSGNPLTYDHRGLVPGRVCHYEIIAVTNEFREGPAASLVIE